MASAIQEDTAIPSQGHTDEYFMRHGDRGHAVIINNKYFDESKKLTRYGTERDAEGMRNLLLDMGFRQENIKTFNDCTKECTMDILQKAAARDYTDMDCFVCVILSHGGNGFIMTKDSKFVAIDELTAQMRKAKCPSLAGKPKIFIVQACSGKAPELGVIRPSDDGSEVAGDGDEEEVKVEPDFVIAHASAPGYVAWKNSTEGSLFIKFLVNVISNNWRQEDLLSMLTAVNKTVASDDDFLRYHLKQMPFFHSQLTKKVFFHTR